MPGVLSDAVALSASGSSLGLRRNGSVMAWGEDNVPAVPAELANVAAIASARAHSLAIRADGTAAAWGRDNDGQSTIPPGLTNAVAAAGGDFHSLILRADGTVTVLGQVVNPDLGFIVMPEGLTNVVAVASGWDHCLALRANGTVAGWGLNDYGQAAVPAGLTDVVAVAAAGSHSLALRADGSLAAWGSFWFNPAEVPGGIDDVASIAAGDNHCVALRRNGTVSAWGDDFYGETVVPGNLGACVAVAGGAGYSLALKGNGPPWLPPMVTRVRTQAGGRVFLRAAPTGLRPMNCQWQRDGVPVPGATDAVLALTVDGLDQAGDYRCIVTNSAGAATGSTVRVSLDPVPVFPLTVSAEHGRVARIPDRVALEWRTDVTLTATPDAGYHFVGWSGDASGAVNPLTITMTNDTAVTALFALNPVAVLADVESLTVPEGSSTTFRLKLSAQPVSDAVVSVSRLSGDADIAVSGGASLTFTTGTWATYQAVAVSAAEDNGDNANGSAVFVCEGTGLTHIVLAAMEADDDVRLTVESLWGIVTLVPAGPYYEKGTEVWLAVAPLDSYFFSGWTGAVGGTNNPVRLVMDADRNVGALFGALAPQVLPPSAIGRQSFKARWRWVEGGAPEGELAVAPEGRFDQPLAGWEALYRINGTECLVTNLSTGQAYGYRVRRLMPDGGTSEWSRTMMVRTGKTTPGFSRLPAGAPVSKGVVQEFAVSNLVFGVGSLKAVSSKPAAVEVRAAEGVLTLRYGWEGAAKARVGLTVTQPQTGYKATYEMDLCRATGSVAVIGRSALTNAGVHAAQEVTLENRTGRTLFGLRVRALGLDKPGWLVNRTGLDPVSLAPIREIPCVLPAGSQTVVRLVYNTAYKKQARTRPVTYGAWAIVPPVGETPPDEEERAIGRQDSYDGLSLLGLAANANRLYAVYWSDDGGDTWTLELPLVRATANYLMWLDLDEAAPANRLYRIFDAGM